MKYLRFSGVMKPLSTSLNRYRIMIGMVLMLVIGAAYPAETDTPYEIEVPVADRSEEQRLEALQVGLEQVLTNIIGEWESIDYAALDEALESPDQYVQQFQYRLKTISDEDTSPVDELVFWARFDPASIDKLLQERDPLVSQQTTPSILITVSGIETIADYAKVSRYLEDLQRGTKVYVTQAMEDHMSFHISMPDGHMRVAEIIQQENILVRVRTTDPEGIPMFRLLP